MSDLIGNKRKREYECDYCDAKFKKSSDLKRHRANVHLIDVIWYECDCCDYKSKNNME